jgi:hypothetical protein
MNELIRRHLAPILVLTEKCKGIYNIGRTWIYIQIWNIWVKNGIWRGNEDNGKKNGA